MAVEIIDGCGIEYSGYAAQGVGSGLGQSFTGDGREITSCDFLLYSSFIPATGIIYAQLYAHTGTYGIDSRPTGPILAISKPVNASLVTPHENFINFGFVGGQRFTTVNGTKYVITLVHPQDASGNHAWAKRTDNEGHLDRHNGNGSYKDTNWIALPFSTDFIFHVYTGDPLDTTPPVITLNGNMAINVALGSTYVDAGATATDDVDGNLTSSIVTVNSVNTAVLGTYTVTYNVTDLSGNAATEVVRTVIVSPVVTKSKTVKNLLILMKGRNR